MVSPQKNPSLFPTLKGINSVRTPHACYIPRQTNHSAAGCHFVSLLGPNIDLSCLFSATLNLCYSTKERICIGKADLDKLQYLRAV
jgi:hypothetical protein